jgi:hypothetical protein
MTEFWSRRWNVTTTYLLRCVLTMILCLHTYLHPLYLIPVCSHNFVLDKTSSHTHTLADAVVQCKDEVMSD